MNQDLQDLLSGPSGGYAIVAVGVVGGALALGAVWLITDYNGWIDFGTGGTSPNLVGYCEITKFRLRLAWSGDDLKDASSVPSIGPSHLKIDLPHRKPPVPELMSRTLPQRQVPSPLDQKLYDRLHALPHNYYEKYPSMLRLDRSITGLTTDAIYAHHELHTVDIDPVLGDEIAHVHPQDNSLHVWLSLADTRKVVDAGWGLRFPLASLKMCHGGWTFLYAPRSDEEIDVVEEVVKARIRHLTGEEI